MPVTAAKTALENSHNHFELGYIFLNSVHVFLNSVHIRDSWIPGFLAITNIEVRFGNFLR